MTILKKLKTILPQNAFVRSVAMIAGGTVLGQGILILVSPLLTRLYTPKDMGLLTAFISLFSILITANSLRYELAIPLAETRKNTATLVILVLVLVLISTILFSLIIWAFGNTLATFLNVPELAPYLWLLVLSLLGGGFYQAFSYWAIRGEMFRPIANTKFVQNLGMAVTQLVMGILGIGMSGLLMGHAVGQFAGLITLSRLAWNENKDLFRQIHLRDLMEMAKRYRRFPLFSSWSAVFNTAGLQLPALFLISIYGAEVAGWFALGQRVIGLPMTMVGTAIGQVYLGRASQIAREKPITLPDYFSRLAKRLFLIGIVPIAILTLVGPTAFSLIFGEEWRIAGEYLQIMSPMFVVQFVVSSLSPSIYVIERQDLQSIWDIFRLILVCIVFIIAAVLGLNPTICIMLYTLTLCITYVILFLLTQRALRHYVRKL